MTYCQRSRPRGQRPGTRSSPVLRVDDAGYAGLWGAPAVNRRSTRRRRRSRGAGGPPLAFTGRYLPPRRAAGRGRVVRLRLPPSATAGPTAVPRRRRFFVLSGFLITVCSSKNGRSADSSDSGPSGRRARRLLPALITMLLLLAAWVAVTKSGTPIDLGQLRDGRSLTIFYVANWQQIFPTSPTGPGCGQSPLKAHVDIGHRRTVLSGVASGDGGHPRWCGPRRRARVGARRAPRARAATRSWRRTGLVVTIGQLLSAAWMAWLRHTVPA